MQTLHTQRLQYTHALVNFFFSLPKKEFVSIRHWSDVALFPSDVELFPSL